MEETDERKVVGIVVGIDEASNNIFRCMLYSKYLEGNTMERLVSSDEEVNKIIDVLEEKGFDVQISDITMNPADWEIRREEIIADARSISEGPAVAKAEEKDAVDTKIVEVQKKAKVSNLKVWGVTLVAVTALLVAGYVLTHTGGKQDVVAPSLNTPSITSTINPQATGTLPGNTVDERIAAMKDQFAKGELYYDITNPDEVQKRVNILIGYFDKMQKGAITSTEATEFYLLMNRYAPSEGVDVDELMRKIQSAAAYDPSFDWREIAGQEIIANKRDSAYLDIYLKAINDWKAAAESHNMKQVASTGKELVATSYYGMILKAPLDTQVAGVGTVQMQNTSVEMQAFIVGYVGMTINYPGYDIKESIGSVTIQGDTIDVNAVAEPIAGPQIIPAGEKGSTDNGGEQGFAQSTMTMIVTKYNNGEYPECPDEIRARLNGLTKAPVKTLK